MNKPMNLTVTKFPMRSTAVNFTNGMIVTDADLTAAMQYPVQLLQMTNRAVHGCGVACGFDFMPDPAFCGTPQPCDPCDSNDNELAFGFKLMIGRGSAFDCTGMPIELCEPVLVDVEPEKCGCSSNDTSVCIAVRRVPAKEAPRGDCCTETPADCARVRDHVEFRAFPSGDLPDDICMRDAGGDKGHCGCGAGEERPYPTGRNEREHNPCDCLKRCDPCDCCGDGWVLLGCVEMCKSGVMAKNFLRQGKEPSKVWKAQPEVYEMRRYIKGIACHCPKEEKKTAEAEAASAMYFQQAIEVFDRPDARIKATLMAADVVDIKTLADFVEDRPDIAKAAFGYSDERFRKLADNIRVQLNPDTAEAVAQEQKKEAVFKATTNKRAGSTKKTGPTKKGS